MKPDLWGCKINQGEDAQVLFPPEVIIEIKALACEMPRNMGLPLSRLFIPDLQREAIQQGIVASISGTTIWRWLSRDAIKPWRYRSWIFPRDPHFLYKASRVLSLYEGFWENKPLGRKDYVISADEKTSIQARKRKHPSVAPGPNQPMRIEHEYIRKGALSYLAAWDVHRAKIFGRCETKSGILAFDRLVDQVMSQEPYCSANRVFWIVDNGSSHRGERFIRRMKERWPTIIPVHLPIHASWLNQIEIYFSIVQRKVLTPNDFSGTPCLEKSLLEFERLYQTIAAPFEWKFTRSDLKKLMAKLFVAQQDIIAV